MGLSRGDIVIVAASGEYGKPRPAVVVQANAFQDLPSVVVALMTSDQRESSRIFRTAIDPTELNGLLKASDVMVDKLFTFSQEKAGMRIGRLTRSELARVATALRMLLGV